MADVFLSYHSQDRARAARIAVLLEARGWSVWWDRQLRAGEPWDDIIEYELAAARCVIVCWSEGAVASHWVREEANVGRKRGILVPVMLDGSEPPLGFQLIHALDLTDWHGSPRATAARALLLAVDDVLRLSEVEAPPAPTFVLGRGVLVLAIIGGMTIALLSARSALQPPAIVTSPSASSQAAAPVDIGRLFKQPPQAKAFEDTAGHRSPKRKREAQSNETQAGPVKVRLTTSFTCRRQPTEARCESLPACDWTPLTAAAPGAGVCGRQRQ